MMVDENLIDKIEKFGFRYLAINCSSHYETLSKKHNLPKAPYMATHCIYDYDEEKVLFFTNASIPGKNTNPWSKSFPLKTYDNLSFLDPYKVDDTYFYQIDKVKPKLSKIEQMYGIDHIWLACVYYSESNIKRMIINTNLFGTYKLIGTREFNLSKLL